ISIHSEATRAYKAVEKCRRGRQDKAQRPAGVTAGGWPEGRVQRVKTGEDAEFSGLNEQSEPVFNAVLPTQVVFQGLPPACLRPAGRYLRRSGSARRTRRLCPCDRSAASPWAPNRGYAAPLPERGSESRSECRACPRE